MKSHLSLGKFIFSVVKMVRSIGLFSNGFFAGSNFVNFVDEIF